VSTFAAEWLALREPYDLAARNAGILEALVQAFVGRSNLRIVDLACGTGATLRAIAPHLPVPQHWRLVDNDLGLLARAATPLPTPPPQAGEGRVGAPPPLAGEEKKAASAPQVTAAVRPIDLVRDLEIVLEAPLDLITASALLDLVSLEWLDRLIIEAAVRQLPIYAALIYDGRVAFEPVGKFDAELLAAFNRHQRTDKGFGPALGAAAAARAVERLEHFGFAVAQGKSDWVLGPTDQAIQEALLAGFAEVGTITLAAADIAQWLEHRRGDVTAGRARLRIGHVDIFARPIERR
jgi:hypothetical protein